MAFASLRARGGAASALPPNKPQQAHDISSGWPRGGVCGLGGGGLLGCCGNRRCPHRLVGRARHTGGGNGSPRPQPEGATEKKALRPAVVDRLGWLWVRLADFCLEMQQVRLGYSCQPLCFHQQVSCSRREPLRGGLGPSCWMLPRATRQVAQSGGLFPPPQNRALPTPPSSHLST